jgi:hypothetical protein
MEADPQSPTVPATPIATVIDHKSAPMMHSPLVDRTQNDDMDMVDVEISNIDGSPDDEQVTRQPRTSRFANLGLNARPSKPTGRKRRFLEIPVLNEGFLAVSTSYQRKWIQGENLTELEALLIPAGLRQAYRNGGALPMDPRPLAPTIKSSKYSTGFLTDSGWQPVNNDEWKIVSRRNHTDKELVDCAHAGRLVNHDGLPGNHAKATVVIQETLHKADFDAVIAELTKDAETPPVDEKYFDLDNYLEHARGSDKRRAKKGAPTKTSILVVPDPNGRSRRRVNIEKAGKNPKVHLKAKNKTDTHRKALAHSSGSDGDATSNDKSAVAIASEESVVTSDLVQADAPIHQAGSVTDPGKNDTTHRDTEPASKPNVKRSHKIYLPIEEAWLILFHKKIKLVVEAGHNVKLAGPFATMERFNEFFAGKVLRDPGGENLPPRGAREEISMKGKLYHVKSGIKALRDVIRKLTEGKHGGAMYVPVITEEELHKYQEKGTVVMDDPDEADKSMAATLSLPNRKRRIVDVEGSKEKRIKQ